MIWTYALKELWPKLLVLLAIVLLILAAGCSPSSEYVKADRATFDAIAPEYLRYVENDTTLDSDQKARRKRTVSTWEMRLRQAEGK